jgi:riboflavin synthase
MFTGIIQEVGKVIGLRPSAGGKRVRIACARMLEGLARGGSISVDGACLTVEEVGKDYFEAFTSQKTLEVTAIGKVKSGTLVNLERPLRLGDELGGHMVLGHVDGVGRVTARRQRAGTLELDVTIPPDLSYGIVPEGSLAVNGVSLTVAAHSADKVRLVIIPLTLAETTLPSLKPGDTVNLEIDIIGKYVYRFSGKEGQMKRSSEGIDIE